MGVVVVGVVIALFTWTRNDVADLRGDLGNQINQLGIEMNGDVKTLRDDLGDFRSGVDEDFELLSDDLEEDIANLSVETKKQFVSLREDLTKEINSLRSDTSSLRSRIRVIEYATQQYLKLGEIGSGTYTELIDYDDYKEVFARSWAIQPVIGSAQWFPSPFLSTALLGTLMMQ